jgi:hypothetical protein
VFKFSVIPARWVALAIVLAPGMAAAAELNLVEGYWETFVTIRLEGGFMPVPAIKSSKCITRQDPLPNTAQSGSRCRISDKTVVGNDVSWHIDCEGAKGRMEGRGKITYAGESFSGSMDMLVTEIGGDRRAKMQYMMRGNRVRACDKLEPGQP